MIPQRPSARVIVDDDFAGDPDGLAALAHQLLTPKTRVTLVTSSAVDPKLADAALAGRSAAAGRGTALELIRRAAARARHRQADDADLDRRRRVPGGG